MQTKKPTKSKPMKTVKSHAPLLHEAQDTNFPADVNESSAPAELIENLEVIASPSDTRLDSQASCSRAINSQPKRAMMNGKYVLTREAKTVLTFDSEAFQHKLLCDGITFNAGDACAFNCSYCYVPSMMLKFDKPYIDAHNDATGRSDGFQDLVIRRHNASEIVHSQLVNSNGDNIYDDPSDNRVIYSSTLVDVAANLELLRETAEICILILRHTHWQIRLLSKSSLLARLITEQMIPNEYHHRLILGFSIGTLDDKLAAAIEKGTGSVSKRVQALHQLQDLGIRTFGMICPSLPQDDYDAFSKEICAAIRVDRCEHVWAEVINVRGLSLTKTVEALLEVGFEKEAQQLKTVFDSSGKDENQEEYARQTFLAHTRNIPADKLRFLQYVKSSSVDWWKERQELGAILIGDVAIKQDVLTTGRSSPDLLPKLEDKDLAFRASREQLISEALSATNVAAKALFEIHSYRDGILWKKEFASFEGYCKATWGKERAHCFRLLNHGRFLNEIAVSNSDDESPSRYPHGAGTEPLEGQVRPLLNMVPRELQVECWSEIASDTTSNLSGGLVKTGVLKFLEGKGIAPRSDKPSKSSKPLKVSDQEAAARDLEKLRYSLKKLPLPARFDLLLFGISELISQPVDDSVDHENHEAA